MLEPQIRTKFEQQNILMIVDDSCAVELWPPAFWAVVVQMPDLEKGVETARKLGELQGECRFWTINYLKVFPIAMGIWTRELSNSG